MNSVKRNKNDCSNCEFIENVYANENNKEKEKHENEAKPFCRLCDLFEFLPESTQRSTEVVL